MSVNMGNSSEVIQRGDLILVDLGGAVGSEQGGVRPCVVVSNWACNKYSKVISVVPTTAQMGKKMMPTHVKLNLKEQSIALCENTGEIDKGRILHKLGSVTREELNKIDIGIMVQFGLYDYIPKEAMYA